MAKRTYSPWIDGRLHTQLRRDGVNSLMISGGDPNVGGFCDNWLVFRLDQEEGWLRYGRSVECANRSPGKGVPGPNRAFANR